MGVHPEQVLRERYASNQDSWPSNAIEFTSQSANDFFGSRVVFYPGSGTDAHAIRLFGGTGAASCFVHADYMVDVGSVKAALASDFLGYKPIAHSSMSALEFGVAVGTDFSHPFADSVRLGPLGERGLPNEREPHFALFLVLEREIDARRVAFLHVSAEAIWVMDVLWARRTLSPFAILLQDHGFGGNWTSFGGPRSELLLLARSSGTLPSWLLVGDENTHPWPGYLRVSCPDDPAGMAGDRRSLYERH